MKRATLVFGIICTILSVAYLVKALQYPLGVMNKPGPAAFPLFAGTLLLIGSIGAVVQTLREAPEGRVEWPKGIGFWRVLALVAAALLYAYGVEFLGHILASMIVILTCLHSMGMSSWRWKIATAMLLAIGSYFLFSKVLSSPLPEGLLEGIL